MRTRSAMAITEPMAIPAMAPPERGGLVFDFSGEELEFGFGDAGLVVVGVVGQDELAIGTRLVAVVGLLCHRVKELRSLLTIR